MAYQPDYAKQEPTRTDIDAQAGVTMLEFGAPWCGYCIGAQPLIAAALAQHPHVQHLKVEDGSGRPLGRSFRVKLWPTLILLRDGMEVARLVRPQREDEVGRVVERLDAAEPNGLPDT